MGCARTVLSTVTTAGAIAGMAVATASSAQRVGAAWAGAPYSSSAGPSSPDGAATSPFVAQARRGVVAAPSLGEVERMCALLTSCDGLPIPPALFPADFPACVKRMTDEMTSPGAVKFSLTMRECGLRADSCASLRVCALHGASAESCKGRGRQGVVGFCDVDGRAVTCYHDEVLAVRDCTRGGEQCVVADGEAQCTLGSCPASARDGEKPHCSASGTHLLHCEKGKLASFDCAAFGLKCTMAGDGTADCATSGPVCSAAAKRCDGNVAVGCFNGHEVRVDCDAAGLACASPPGAVAVGACVSSPASTGGCDPSEKASCEGERIRYCYAGAPRAYSCRALGFRRCELGKGGVHCAS